MVVVVVEAVEKVVKSLGASPLFPFARFSRYNKKRPLDKRSFLCYARITENSASIRCGK